MGSFLQGVQAALVEGPDGVAHRLGGASQLPTDRRWGLAARTGQEDLAATQGEGIGRAQARLQGVALGVREWTHVQRRLHPSCLHIIHQEIALATSARCLLNPPSARMPSLAAEWRTKEARSR